MGNNGRMKYYYVLAQGITQRGELDVYALAEAIFDEDDDNRLRLNDPIGVFIMPTDEVVTGPQYPSGTVLSVKAGDIVIPMVVKSVDYVRD